MATLPRGLRREDFQIAIFCAVGCEYDAVTYAFDEIWEGAEVQLGNAPGDFNKYKVGRIANRDSVLLLLAGMGKVNAASAAASLRSSFTEIKLAVLAGICGGVPGVGTDQELMLGDVVISRCIVQYDLGRRYADRFAMKDTIEDSLGRPHESVRSLTAVFETNTGRETLQQRTSEILQSIQQRASNEAGIETYRRPPMTDDYLFEPDYLHRHHCSQHCECSDLAACEAARQASCDELRCDFSRLVSRGRLKKRKLQDMECDTMAAHELRVLVGRLGSGDTVMKSGLDRDRIAGEQDLIAFEMEGAGIWDRFPCVVVKAVCDYADSHKNKQYQTFAAARAASATKAILEAFPCTEISARFQAEHVENSDGLRQLRSTRPNIQPVMTYVREHDDNDRRLLQLLAADHEAHKNFNTKRVTGTCEWFLRDERYRQWLESSTSNIIWVSAGPGCGKSVLTRALIDDEQLSTGSVDTTVCYFFFKEGDERRINSYDALSAILHQLFTQKEARCLIDYANTAFKNYGEKLRSSFHQLWKILVDCARNNEAGEIVCVLDALDECSKEGRHDILQALETFYFSDEVYVSSSRLKFLITSRPYDDLEVSFERMTITESYIRLDGDEKSEEIRHEIDLVIDHRVKDFGKDFREEHRDAISERLKTMENRTYLWLHLTFSIIDERRSAYHKPSTVQALLSNIPASVFDAYEKILSRSQDREQARNLLNIVLTAAEPMTLDQVNYALTLQTRVYKSHDEDVEMILEDEFRRKEASFMAYAACNWTVHYNSQNSAARAELCQAVRDICRTARGRGPAWAIQFEMRDFRTGHEYASHCSDVTLASYFGLLDVAEYIIREENVDVNSEGGYFGTAIKAAAAGGHLSLVQALIQHEADSETGGGYFPTALVAAFAQGHLKVAQYLIGRGHRITQEVVEAAVSQENDVQQIAHLIENFNEHVTITKKVTEAAAANPIWGADILAFLLDRRGDQVEITQEILETATANEGCGDEIMSLLINTRGDALDITEETLKSAAGNNDCGAEIMRLLIEEYGDMLDITSAVFQTAARSIDGFATMELLMQEGWTEFEITPEILNNIAGNSFCGLNLIGLLVAERWGEFEITQEVILAAAERGSEDTMKFFLDEFRDIFQLTPELILAVAGNTSHGGKMMTLLLETFGNRVIITQDVIMTAARASYLDETLAVLLDHRGSDLKITKEIVIAAAMNVYGEGPMAYLLEEHGMEVDITQELISAVRGNTMCGGRMMALLRDKRGDEVKLYERDQV